MLSKNNILRYFTRDALLSTTFSLVLKHTHNLGRVESERTTPELSHGSQQKPRPAFNFAEGMRCNGVEVEWLGAIDQYIPTDQTKELQSHRTRIYLMEGAKYMLNYLEVATPVEGSFLGPVAAREQQRRIDWRWTHTPDFVWVSESLRF